MRKARNMQKMPDANIREEGIARFGVSRIKNYATEVNLDRAVPDIFDGLKPVQRRALWAMSHVRRGEIVKTAKVVGECFAEGTLVSLVSGDVLIEDVKIGDEVITDTGIFPVTNLFLNRDCYLYRITLSDGTSVDATSDQIFYCIDNNGNEVERTPLTLKPGDKIKCLS